MWLKTSRVVYIDTRWLFLKVMVLILTITAVLTYWNWTKVTVIEFKSDELEAQWSISNSEMIRKICSGIKKSKITAEVKIPISGIRVRLYSKMEIREYLWNGADSLLDKKTGRVIKVDSNLKEYLELAALEIKKRSPYGEILDWKEVKGVFRLGDRALIRDIDTGIKFMVCRSGGYSHAEIETLNREDTVRLKAIFNGTLNWKRRAVVMQIGGRNIAASLTGAPHGQGKLHNNDLYGKVGLYFSNKEQNNGFGLSHQMMIWKAAGKTRNYLQKMTPEELIIAAFTAIDQHDLKSLKLMTKHPEVLKGSELDQIIGVTVTGMKKIDPLSYDVKVSVSLKKGPYNHKRYIRVNLYKNSPRTCYLTDNKLLEKLTNVY